MDFFETVEKRRSIRKFTEKSIPPEVVHRALDAAILAPNSSNVQTWDFYWVKSPEKKSKLIEACLSQAAARTAAELIVVVADPSLWRRSQAGLIAYTEQVNAPKLVKDYYKKLIPITYSYGWFNSLGLIKKILYNCVGLFRPTPRSPATMRDLQEVASKSAALAAQNFVLAMTAQGFQTCMMEGFDACRVSRLLGLKSPARPVMVIGMGQELPDGKGTWGGRYRIDKNLVVHEI